jgi:hypothetical protein
MNLLHARLHSQSGQGMIEYTLVVLLVTLGFWLELKTATWAIFGQELEPGKRLR